MPSASFSHSAPISAHPSVVWDRLQEADAWAEIGPIDDVWDATHDESGHLRSFRWSTRAAGRSYQGTATTESAVPGESMVVHLDTSEVKGNVAVALSDGSISVEMGLRPAGLLATMFFSVVADTVGGGLGGHVDEFAEQFAEPT